jgi:hypothetical protein
MLGTYKEHRMNQMLHLSSIRVFVDRSSDDLEPARGAGIAALMGLAFWATAFAVWNWII